MQSFKIFRNVLFHGHFVEEEPAGAAYAVMPRRTGLDAFDFDFDIAGPHRLCDRDGSRNELHGHRLVLRKFHLPERCPVRVVGRNGVAHRTGQQNPLAQLVQEIGLDRREGHVAAQIDDEGALPPDFVTTTVTTKPDKTAIKKAIQAGQAVAGAVLVENQNLQIK